MDNAKLAIYVSLCSLALALFTFGWNVINQLNQNEKWQALNAPNVEITKAKLALSKSFGTEEEIRKIDWGYSPTFQPDNGNVLLLRITSSLIATYLGKRLEHFNPAFTIKEAEAQLKTMGIIDKYEILKLYKVAFQIENKGNTEAKDVKTKVSYIDPFTKEMIVAIKGDTAIDLSPGILTFVAVEYGIPYKFPHPEKTDYTIEISYRDTNGKLYSKLISATYLRDDNSFTYNKVQAK